MTVGSGGQPGADPAAQPLRTLGVTGVDAGDEDPDPTLLRANTVILYGVPSVNPSTRHRRGWTAVTEQVCPDGVAVTVYPVMAAPPSVFGAVQETCADSVCAATTGLGGAPGTVAGVTGVEGVEGVLVPSALVAVTRKV